MNRVRRHIAFHRSWAVWFLALTLALRVMVPTGYMPDVRDGRVTIQLCDGAGPVPMAMPGMAHHQHDPHQHDNGGQPCAFAGATIAGLDTVATIAVAVPLLPLAVFNRVALPRAPPLASLQRLRPPSQAPPVHG